MNATRLKQIEEIYHRAAEIAPEKRESFFEESCGGDAELRREVESLLSFEESSDNFLDAPPEALVAEMFVESKEQISLIDREIGHYKIKRLLGAGGMGEVYLAEDARLNRKVALKFLSAPICDDKNVLRRFEQEAFAASALNHPNILTIYEFEAKGEVCFLAAEYIEGETLREHSKSGLMPLQTALDIAIQMASALGAAHSAGIVHRDLKPENIMIRLDGIVKVLDFGLAKLTENSDGESATRALVQTRAGAVMGTVGYMSPEQAKGKDIDERTDVWSLGVVLYEMITSQPPFTGETANERIASILKTEPFPLSHYVSDIPKELERIVGKSLRKNREERYRHIEDFRLDLKDLKQDLEFQNKLERTASPNRKDADTRVFNRTTSDFAPAASSAEYIASEIKQHKPVSIAVLLILLLAIGGLSFWYFGNRSSNPAQIESIAVMPFVNESGNADVEYLSDGMTETLINSLSQLPKLSVKARSSVFRYKGKDTDAKQVGADLNVQAVLNGRIVQRGSNLALSLELVDAGTGNQIWGEQYNRQQTDLVALQSEIARDVSQKLRTRLSGADAQRVAKTYTANPEAYKLYLRGLYHWHKRTPEDIRKSIALFRQATEKDPLYAQAYAGLGLAYGVLSSNSVMTKEEANENRLKRRAALSKAQELDDSLAEVHADLGGYKSEVEWNHVGAENEFKLAIELNPSFASARQWYSEFLSRMGRHEEALAEINKAHEIDPFSRAVNGNIAARLYEARRFDEAVAQYKKVIEMEPNYPSVRGGLARVYEAKGMYSEAIAETRIVDILLEKDSAESSERKAAAFTQALKIGGAQSYWRKHLELSLKEYEQGYVSAFGIAETYAQLGEKDIAFEWLEKSFAAHEVNLVVIKAKPAFDGLSSDPRFQDLLRRVGLPQ